MTACTDAADSQYRADVSQPYWDPEPQNEISFELRREIFDWLENTGIHWAGDQDEVGFLGRLYDLEKLPSTDYRFETAARDINQHRVFNPEDWPDEWVYEDSRFNLKSGPDGRFLDFLAATVSPRTHRGAGLVQRMVDTYNAALRPCGFELYVKAHAVGGDPVYGWRPVGGGHHVPTTSRLAGPDYADRAVLRQHLERIERDLDVDPSAAIDSSKNLIESLCKVILEDRGLTYSDRDDLPALFRATCDELGITAASVPGSGRGSDAVRLMLRTLSTTVQAVGEARNAIGDGHGSATGSPAEIRHARLAFNATLTVCEFVADTWVQDRSPL